MLKLKIDYIAGLRGIGKVYTFVYKLGLSHSKAQRLSAGDVKSINLVHLEKLCIALQCTPNDLLEWQADQPNISTDHPLHTLVRDPRRLENLEKIKNLSLDQLERLNDMIGDLE